MGIISGAAKVIAILPAAGIGIRIQNPLPKQYLMIGNKTVIEYAIQAIFGCSCISEVIVAINANDRWYHQLPIANDQRIRVVTGGLTRADSVMAALRHTRGSTWVLVHDAVRPCLHQDDLRRLLSIIGSTEVGGVLAVPVSDTIKCCTQDSLNLISSTIKRDNLWQALTPQLFARDLLVNCLEETLKRGLTITDESSALEYCGYSPLLVHGRSDNIKVTRPEDLALARCFLLN